MMFFVKTEVVGGRVDELAQKIVDRAIQPVEGNIVFVSADGCLGYNLVEGASEAAVRQKFEPYRDHITIREITPVVSMGHYIEQWITQRAA
ncbi:MAG: hypothetical protein HYY04_10500 [Chloroflexi bacterium]|nr:hypothetical protein [Chloroflexota bacterium]